MINCIGGPPQFKHGLALEVYYARIAEGDDEHTAMQFALLLDVFMEPEMIKLMQRLGNND